MMAEPKIIAKIIPNTSHGGQHLKRQWLESEMLQLPI